MKTLMVAGPRDVPDLFRVNLMIDGYFAARKAGGDRLRVVHGKARGVDTLAAASAERHGFTVEPFPVIGADVKRAIEERGNGMKAPLYRTLRILETEQPDEVVAWWDGKSPGTGFTITQARRRNIRTEVIRI